MRIVLHTPDGRTFEVNPAKIDMLEEARTSAVVAGTKAVIYVGPHMQGVRETVEHIKELENEALHRPQQPESKTA